jgi:ribonuclease HI
VIFDAHGQILERLGKYLGPVTNNVAEYEALLLGLRRAVELGAGEVEVRADSELLIRQLQGRYKVKHPAMQALFAKAQVLLGQLGAVEFTHVPREKNTDADEMSNRAIDERM